MLGNILILDEDGALVLHVAGGRARVLIIVTVVLDSKTSRRNDPVAADRHFLGVIARPDLHFVNITVGKTSSRHLLVERGGILVVTLLAFKQRSFTTNEDFKVGHKVFGKITTAQVTLKLGKDSSK